MALVGPGESMVDGSGCELSGWLEAWVGRAGVVAGFEVLAIEVGSTDGVEVDSDVMIWMSSNLRLVLRGLSRMGHDQRLRWNLRNLENTVLYSTTVLKFNYLHYFNTFNSEYTGIIQYCTLHVTPLHYITLLYTLILQADCKVTSILS